MKARYAIGGIVAAALLAMPAGAAASQGDQTATTTAQQCSQQRADIGRKAFRKRYGARHSMRICMKRTRPTVVAALGTANSDCQDELTESGATEFTDDYGEDATDTLENAIAECIAENADEILNPEGYGDDGEDDGSDA